VLLQSVAKIKEVYFILGRCWK